MTTMTMTLEDVRKMRDLVRRLGQREAQFVEDLYEAYGAGRQRVRGRLDRLRRRIRKLEYKLATQGRKPMLFTYHRQPYGTVVMAFNPALVTVYERTPADWERKWYGPDKEYWMVRLQGIVVKGSETSRLFQHTSTRDLKGTCYSVVVPAEDFIAGQYTLATCG